MGGKSYWKMALIVGVFTTLVAEFTRRVINPYEDTKIAENGDVPEYGND